MTRAKNLTGKRFGHLIAINHDGYTRDHKWLWLCICDCGNLTHVSSSHLTSGHTSSCGHVKFDRDHTVAPGYEAKRVDGVATFLLSENRKMRSDNKTGVTGVKIHHRRDGSIDYQADITVNKKHYYLGRYLTIGEAKRAREKAELRLIPKK